MQTIYGTSFISLSLDICPKYVFIGAYIKECHDNGKVVFMGGDWNSRRGNFNLLSDDSTWIYNNNIDNIKNGHGRIFSPEICKVGKMIPINHLKYKGNVFDGNFTYQSGHKKRQIDFVMTDIKGRENIVKFNIIENNWHLSDHKPVGLKIAIDREADKEQQRISQLQSNVTIPVLDEPINRNEVEQSLKDMKKLGFDYNLPVLRMLKIYFSEMMLLLLNFMFFIKYLLYLALSLLFVIPKKGNLMMPENFRGVQMMRAVACLFDCVIAKRIYTWMNIETEQFALQKGKITLIQIFTLRLLIEICLYILPLIEKSFDKVSRYKLLARLVTLGIGNVMLEVLKRIYLTTFCVLNLYGQFSESFATKTGVRQGSASLVLLFILFMDGLFAFLCTHCKAEEIIKKRSYTHTCR